MVDLEPGWSFGVKSFMCKYGLVILYYRLLNYSILTKQSQFWLHVSAFFRSCGPHRVILIGRWSLFSCYRDWCELVPWCDFIRFYPCWPCNTFMPIFKPTWRKYLVDLDLGLFFLLLSFPNQMTNVFSQTRNHCTQFISQNAGCACSAGSMKA